jgi:ABC-type glycerol-3-phosphate transport system permease component
LVNSFNSPFGPVSSSPRCRASATIAAAARSWSRRVRDPVPFVLLTAVKNRQDAADLSFTWPKQFQIVQNFTAVVQARDYLLIITYINSIVLTVCSVIILVVLASMVAYVLQRRKAAGRA